jgi:hypothetical protein
MKMDTETDMETDIETDMETNMDMDKDTDMELEYFCWISIRRYSRYCGVWITCDTSRCKFQQRYKLVAPLLNDYYDMLILRNSYCHWDFSPNEVLAKLEVSVWG